MKCFTWAGMYSNKSAQWFISGSPHIHWQCTAETSYTGTSSMGVHRAGGHYWFKCVERLWLCLYKPSLQVFFYGFHVFHVTKQTAHYCLRCQIEFQGIFIIVIFKFLLLEELFEFYLRILLIIYFISVSVILMVQKALSKSTHWVSPHWWCKSDIQWVLWLLLHDRCDLIYKGINLKIFHWQKYSHQWWK